MKTRATTKRAASMAQNDISPSTSSASLAPTATSAPSATPAPLAPSPPTAEGSAPSMHALPDLSNLTARDLLERLTSIAATTMSNAELAHLGTLIHMATLPNSIGSVQNQFLISNRHEVEETNEDGTDSGDGEDTEDEDDDEEDPTIAPAQVVPCINVILPGEGPLKAGDKVKRLRPYNYGPLPTAILGRAAAMAALRADEKKHYWKLKGPFPNDAELDGRCADEFYDAMTDMRLQLDYKDVIPTTEKKTGWHYVAGLAFTPQSIYTRSIEFIYTLKALYHEGIHLRAADDPAWDVKTNTFAIPNGKQCKIKTFNPVLNRFVEETVRFKGYHNMSWETRWKLLLYAVRKNKLIAIEVMNTALSLEPFIIAPQLKLKQKGTYKLSNASRPGRGTTMPASASASHQAAPQQVAAPQPTTQQPALQVPTPDSTPEEEKEQDIVESVEQVPASMSAYINQIATGTRSQSKKRSAEGDCDVVATKRQSIGLLPKSPAGSSWTGISAPAYNSYPRDIFERGLGQSVHAPQANLTVSPPPSAHGLPAALSTPAHTHPSQSFYSGYYDYQPLFRRQQLSRDYNAPYLAQHTPQPGTGYGENVATNTTYSASQGQSSSAQMHDSNHITDIRTMGQQIHWFGSEDASDSHGQAQMCKTASQSSLNAISDSWSQDIDDIQNFKFRSDLPNS